MLFSFARKETRLQKKVIFNFENYSKQILSQSNVLHVNGTAIHWIDPSKLMNDDVMLLFASYSM